jgi:hypothetical protein
MGLHWKVWELVNFCAVPRHSRIALPAWAGNSWESPGSNALLTAADGKSTKIP